MNLQDNYVMDVLNNIKSINMDVKKEKEKLKREIINSLTYFEHSYNQIVRINEILNE